MYRVNYPNIKSLVFGMHETRDFIIIEEIHINGRGWPNFKRIRNKKIESYYFIKKLHSYEYRS